MSNNNFKPAYLWIQEALNDWDKPDLTEDEADYKTKILDTIKLILAKEEKKSIPPLIDETQENIYWTISESKMQKTNPFINYLLICKDIIGRYTYNQIEKKEYLI